MTNILITGGYGFIGSNLIYSLLSYKEFKIFVIDNFSKNKITKINQKVKFFKNDILNINQINSLKKKIDIVIHLAASAEILINKENEDKYFSDNVTGLQEVLNFCAINNVKKFIFASSASVYGDTKNKKIRENFKFNPMHFYGYTKFIGEKMTKFYSNINKIDFTILRFFNIYGPNSDAVIGTFLAQNFQNKKLTVFGRGAQMRDFLHVSDLSNAVIKILKNKKSKNKTYNLGSGKSVSIKYLSRLIGGKNVLFLPKRNDDISISVANINRIFKDLNWKPKISIEDGISSLKIQENNRLKKIKLKTPKKLTSIIKKFNKKL
ncbi:NAD-dependent epimerase/dehydratase family protein [Candidatus Pelagibacter sp.]|nr:NAD-dependent epimerase/dehydratase family protein [Candidatus Pelagibacter sp.]